MSGHSPAKQPEVDVGASGLLGPPSPRVMDTPPIHGARGWVIQAWKLDDALSGPHPHEPAIDASSLLKLDLDEVVGERQDKESRWIAYSVGLHGLLVLVMVLFVRPAPQPDQPPESMEVNWVDLDIPEIKTPAKALQPPVRTPEDSHQGGQIVDLPEVNEKVPPPKNARFLAANNHRVEKETQARKTELNPLAVSERAVKSAKIAGDDAEHPSESKSIPQAREPLDKVQKEVAATSLESEDERSEPSDDGVKPPPEGDSRDPGMGPSTRPRRALKLFPSHSQIARALSRPPSRAGGGMPDRNLYDLERGDATRLNARRSEFHRYLNQLRRQYNYYYDQASQNLSRRNVGGHVVRGRYRTEFRVTILSDGRITNVRILSSSGVEAFDRVALKALRMASPFPAPPKGMLDEQGSFVIRGTCQVGVGMGIPSFGGSL